MRFPSVFNYFIKSLNFTTFLLNHFKERGRVFFLSLLIRRLFSSNIYCSVCFASHFLLSTNVYFKNPLQSVFTAICVTKLQIKKRVLFLGQPLYSFMSLNNCLNHFISELSPIAYLFVITEIVAR